MQKKRNSSKTFLQVEQEAKAVDVALGRLESARAVFEKSRTEVALEVGAVLAAAQKKLSRYGDGVFIRWIQERLGLKKMTAYKWLRLHEYFGDCPQCVRTIDVSGLYVLANDGPVYQNARENALALAAKGRRVPRQAVIRILQAHRDEAKIAGWDDDDLPEVPGDLTTLQKLKGIWRRATVEERRQFREWATETARARKERGLLRKLAAATTTDNG
jgi:hypothetical protein